VHGVVCNAAAEEMVISELSARVGGGLFLVESRMHNVMLGM
jgi:hypothetical protein